MEAHSEECRNVKEGFDIVGHFVVFEWVVQEDRRQEPPSSLRDNTFGELKRARCEKTYGTILLCRPFGQLVLVFAQVPVDQ